MQQSIQCTEQSFMYLFECPNKAMASVGTITMKLEFYGKDVKY